MERRPSPWRGRPLSKRTKELEGLISRVRTAKRKAVAWLEGFIVGLPRGGSCGCGEEKAVQFVCGEASSGTHKSLFLCKYHTTSTSERLARRNRFSSRWKIPKPRLEVCFIPGLQEPVKLAYTMSLQTRSAWNSEEAHDDDRTLEFRENLLVGYQNMRPPLISPRRYSRSLLVNLVSNPLSKRIFTRGGIPDPFAQVGVERGHGFLGRTQTSYPSADFRRS
eukprot:scaffold55858_cov100-Cyclotella_meneghiniana.AAC.4